MTSLEVRLGIFGTRAFQKRVTWGLGYIKKKPSKRTSSHLRTLVFGASPSEGHFLQIKQISNSNQEALNITLSYRRPFSPCFLSQR